MDATVIDPDLVNIHHRDTSLPEGDHGTATDGLGGGRGQLSPLAARNITSAPAETRNVGARLHPEYPSPSISTLDSAGFGGTLGHTPQDGQSIMLPPFRSSTATSPNRVPSFYDEPASLQDHRAKRVKLGPPGDASPFAPSPLPFESMETQSSTLLIGDARSPNLPLANAFSPFANSSTPLTPGSSIASEQTAGKNASVPNQTPPDLRKLSVSSLLADNSSENYKPYKRSPRQYPITSPFERTTTYGYDTGNYDLDLPNNDDTNAIMIVSPPASRENTFNERKSSTDSDWAGEFGFGSRARDMAFEPGGYYTKPVPIKIPYNLEPLPQMLLDNKMNLLYFHHFLNHTARILVPHDCEQNPFRKILPEMALGDEDLLKLLLAYSASHRARLLGHPEPSNRIALWVEGVFPKLRKALESSEPISIKNLATAIMLASLEIIAPNAFEVKIPWRSHLSFARQMIITRGGPQSILKQNKVSYFLSRWFAYLDVMGSLSGRKNDRPLNCSYLVVTHGSNCDNGQATIADDDDDDNGDVDEDPYQIDCLLGFTTRCVGILAQIAELAKECERFRLDENGDVRDDWQPGHDVVQRAEQLRLDLQEAREHTYKACPHRGPSENESEAGWDSQEIMATNEMFHWAGLIHLARRVLNRPSDDPEVQNAVRMIVAGLYKIRHGSTAEACLLFPMFTAGCDAQEQSQRDRIMSRLRSVENFGMTQIHKARALMQQVWDTGKPWESLVSDEFFG